MADKPQQSRLSARELILTLMDSTRAGTLSASYLIAAGTLFEMDPGSIRVALARLVRDGSLVGAGRGRYALGSRGGTLQSLVQNWSRAEASLVDWQGDWITVLTGHLARSNKASVRGNERALSLFGFAQLHPGIWLRPSNLSRDLAQIRADLIALGLDPEGICTNVHRFEPAEAIDPERLWETKALARRYRDNADLLSESRSRLADADDATAARETLLIGRRVTRDILLDPLLPDALVDAAARRRMIEAMREYDRIGKAYWREFYDRHVADGVQVGEGVTGAPQKPAA